MDLGRFLAAAALLLAGRAGAGEVRGTIRFAGAAPGPSRLQIGRDRSSCGASAPDESLLVAGGRLANVVVTVRGAPAPPSGRALVLDQQGCRYLPHVLAATRGSSLEIVNSDPVLHNVHGYLGSSTTFNVAMPLRKQTVTRKLEQLGTVKVKCDVHAWMTAYIVVADGPSAVTGPDGAYAIPNVPPGSYTATAWHERLGEKSAPLTVPPSGGASVDFTFGG
jgi:plastocyanin